MNLMRRTLLFVFTFSIIGVVYGQSSVKDLGRESKPVVYQQKSTNDSCNYDQPGNNFEAGRWSRFTGNTIDAACTDDFIIPANHCWVVKGFIANHWYEAGAQAYEYWGIIWGDSSATEYPSSQRILSYQTTNFDTVRLANNFGFPIWEVTTMLSTYDTICAGSSNRRVWFTSMLNSPSSGSEESYWSFRTDTSFNNTPAKYANPIPNWFDQGDSAMEFTIIYEELVQLNNPFADTVCMNGGVVNLPSGNPSGGTYSGPAVSGSQFDPSITGTGTFWFTYSYTNSQGCTSSDSINITVESCASIRENGELSVFKAYPNPVEDKLIIEMEDATADVTVNNIEVYNLIGDRMKVEVSKQFNNFIINTEHLSKGTYLVNLETDRGIKTFKVVK